MDTLQKKPRIKQDTNCWLLFHKQSGNIYCLGNVQNNKFIKIYENQIKDVRLMLKLMDGKITLSKLTKKINSFNIIALYKTMCKAGLIVGYNSNYKNNEFELYSFMICKLSVIKLKTILQNISKALINPIITSICLIAILITFTINIISIPTFMTAPSTYRIFSSDAINLFIYYCISLISILLHELGHGLFASKYDIPPSFFTIALYLYVTPIVYLSIPGIYTKSPKQRIYIWGAGIYVNAIICTVALIVHAFFDSQLAALIFVVNLTLIMVNISPLMPLDGYFIACTLLKSTNIRSQFLHPFTKRYWRQSNNYIKLYSVLSLAMMVYIIFTQVNWLSRYFVSAYHDSTTFFQFIFNIRLLLMAIVIFAFSRLIKWYGKQHTAHG